MGVRWPLAKSCVAKAKCGRKLRPPLAKIEVAWASCKIVKLL